MDLSTLGVVRGADRAAANDALASACGGRVGLEGVLDDLDRSCTFAHGLGRGVAWALRWDKADDSTRRWWPQGITSSGDARTGPGNLSSVVLTTAYRKGADGRNEGSRVTVVDLRDRSAIRYRHVLLVTATVDDEGPVKVRPVRAHAGGIVWRGPFLHVAATATGFHTFRLADLLVDAPAGSRAFRDETGLVADGRRYLLPLWCTHGARTEGDVRPFRYSFVSVSSGFGGGRLLAGEYGRSGSSHRLLAFALDETGLPAGRDGVAVPSWGDDRGLIRMQGAVQAGDGLYATTSNGRRPGVLWSGGPGRWAEVAHLPKGPEDLSYWADRDQLLTVTEHPGHRFVLGLDRSALG